MKIIGITGSIGMGKSFIASCLEDAGIPVFDADEAAHATIQPGGSAYADVVQFFPDATENGVVNRKTLGQIVYEDKAKLDQLEQLIHPWVRQERMQFLKHAMRARKTAVAYDIPLLFETGADEECDVVLVASAPPQVQEERVLRRPGMTKEKLAHVRARQWPEAQKKAMADVVINTGLSKAETRKQVHQFLTRAGIIGMVDEQEDDDAGS